MLSGCATFIVSNIGATATTIQTAQTVDMVKSGAEAASVAGTGKTLSDHMLSRLTGKDCRMFNVFDHKNICRVKKTYFYLGGEDGQKRRLARSGGVSFRYIETVEPTRSPTEEIRRTPTKHTGHKLSKVKRVSKTHRPKAKKQKRGVDKLR